MEVVPADGNGILSSGTQDMGQVRKTVGSVSICSLPCQNFRPSKEVLVLSFQFPQFQKTICPLWGHMVDLSPLQAPSTKESRLPSTVCSAQG